MLQTECERTKDNTFFVFFFFIIEIKAKKLSVQRRLQIANEFLLKYLEISGTQVIAHPCLRLGRQTFRTITLHSASSFLTYFTSGHVYIFSHIISNVCRRLCWRYPWLLFVLLLSRPRAHCATI